MLHIFLLNHWHISHNNAIVTKFIWHFRYYRHQIRVKIQWICCQTILYLRLHNNMSYCVLICIHLVPIDYKNAKTMIPDMILFVYKSKDTRCVRLRRCASYIRRWFSINIFDTWCIFNFFIVYYIDFPRILDHHIDNWLTITSPYVGRIVI